MYFNFDWNMRITHFPMSVERSKSEGRNIYYEKL